MTNTTHDVLERFEDNVHPHRFDNEKETFIKLVSLNQKGFLSDEELGVLVDVYSDFLSSKGY